MTWATKAQRTTGFQVRGRIGLPNLCGWAICGWSHCGDDNEKTGVYQMRYSDKGRVMGEPRRGHQNICYMRPCWPTQPPSEARDAQQAKFKTALAAWQALTSEQKKAYNTAARRYGKRGYDVFMSQTLKSL